MFIHWLQTSTPSVFYYRTLDFLALHTLTDSKTHYFNFFFFWTKVDKRYYHLQKENLKIICINTRSKHTDHIIKTEGVVTMQQHTKLNWNITFTAESGLTSAISIVEPLIEEQIDNKTTSLVQKLYEWNGCVQKMWNRYRHYRC